VNGRLDKGVEYKTCREIGDDVMQLILWGSRNGVNAETRQVQAPWQFPHLPCARSTAR
jgi:hypothetical protein